MDGVKEILIRRLIYAGSGLEVETDVPASIRDNVIAYIASGAVPQGTTQFKVHSNTNGNFYMVILLR